MGVQELLRDQQIQGAVLDRYRMENGNIGLVVEDEAGERYSVEFQTNYVRPCFANLYGLINEPFKRNGDRLERLLIEGDRVELSVGYKRGPMRTAYALHNVTRGSPAGQAQNQRPLLLRQNNGPY